ncbi:cutinase family protein [Williamsia sp. D3]|uniref:cutinase family protein n=1 Tax=Williamsia TaxID=85043 RepID=UPI0009DD6F48|nr:cutinase family protein [Williamsia sp. D3]
MSRAKMRPLVAGLATLSVTLTVVATVPATASAAQPSSCTPYMAYLVPGTWETTATADPSKPAGLLGKVGAELEESYGSQITVIYPNYSASAFDKGQTYASSEADGVQRLRGLLEQCPESQNVLGGYSQGADVAGDVAWQIGNGQGPVDPDKIDAVGLVADPKQGNAPVAGPAPTGKGIAGTRPGGFGTLADKVRQVCAPGDLYCSTNSSEHSFIAGLGQMLGSSGNGETAPTTTTVADTTTSTTPTTGSAVTSPADAQALTSDYSRTDVPGTVGAATALNDQIAELQGQPAPASGGQASQIASLASLAGQLLETFTAVADTQQWVQTTPGADKYLSNAKPGTPAAQANSLLSTFNAMDVPAILSTTSSIASSLSQALGSSPTVPLAGTTTTSSTTPTTASSGAGSTTTPSAASPTSERGEAGGAAAVPTGEAVSVSPTVPTGAGEGSAPAWQGTGALPTPQTGGAAPDYAALGASTAQLVAQVAPLNSADKTALTSAATVLGGLKPEVLIGQGLNVVTAVTSTDYRGIVAGLQRLPQQIFTGDIPGAHKTAGDLNNMLSPWVTMAAQIDFKTAAKLVALIPDPSGTTQIASVVLGLLGNLDIVRLARNVGQLQEVAWQVLESHNLMALTQLLPIGLDLASVALGVLEPGAKMSPELLGAGATPEQQALATHSQGQDMVGMFGSLTQLVSSQGAQDLSKLVGEGLTAATFYASNAHGQYDKLIIDGKTALDWLYDFFREALGG